MNERELLEVTRLAAGIRGGNWDGRTDRSASGNEARAPLDDDGDAFRLAIKLKCFAMPVPGFDSALLDRFDDEVHYAAIRRAIVITAAALGKP